MDYLSNDIKQLRIDAGLTQNDLAQALGIPQSQISRYEENPDAISFGLLKKWQERFMCLILIWFFPKMLN